MSDNGKINTYLTYLHTHITIGYMLVGTIKCQWLILHSSHGLLLFAICLVSIYSLNTIRKKALFIFINNDHLK